MPSGGDPALLQPSAASRHPQGPKLYSAPLNLTPDRISPKLSYSRISKLFEKKSLFLPVIELVEFSLSITFENLIALEK